MLHLYGQSYLYVTLLFGKYPGAIQLAESTAKAPLLCPPRHDHDDDDDDDAQARVAT